MCIGDLPIMSESMNTSTLISRTNVQLLVIQKDDFLDIFVRSFFHANQNETQAHSTKVNKKTDGFVCVCLWG